MLPGGVETRSVQSGWNRVTPARCAVCAQGLRGGGRPSCGAASRSGGALAGGRGWSIRGAISPRAFGPRWLLARSGTGSGNAEGSGPFPALCAHRPRSLTTRRLCAPSPPSARGTRVCAQSHVAPEPLPAAAAGPPSLPSPRPLTTAWDALHFLSWPVSLARLSAPRQGLLPLSSPVHHSCRGPVWRRVGPARTGGSRAGAAGWAPLPGGRRPRRGRSLTARLRACRGRAGGGGRRASERPSFGRIVLRLLAESRVHVFPNNRYVGNIKTVL